MKHNILYLVLVIFLSFAVNAQEIGFINEIGTPKLENVINNDITDVPIVIGKTYSIGTNNYNVSTSTNDSIIMKFACDTAFKYNGKTSVNIDGYEQTTTESEYLQETIYSEYNCNVSLLSGEVEVINNATVDDTNNFYLNTKMACIIFGKGKFITKSSEKSSTFIIIEGTATVMDNLSRKLYKLKEKDIVTVTPRPNLSGKASELLVNKNVVTTSQLDNSDYGVLINEMVLFDKQQKRYIFIALNKTNILTKLK